MLMNKNITKRLTRDSGYQKQKKSYQENLSPDEIKKKLEEYSQIDYIDDVPLNSHIRYFTVNLKTGKKLFRLGGFLTKIEDDYVILSNGQLSWSVQKKNTVFFRKMAFQDLKNELKNKIKKSYETEIKKLKEEVKKLKETLKKVKKELKN
jgi:hypothetical protein